MSRDLPPELQAAIDEPVVRPFLAFHIDLPDPVWVWTGRGVLSFPDGTGIDREWIGAGDVGAIDPISEETDGSATGIKIALFNIPSEFREDIAAQATKGAKGEVFAGALNETYQEIEGAQMIGRNRVDDYRITDAGDTITTEVSLEPRSIDQRRPAQVKFTDEHHQRHHSGDLFFQYQSQMSRVEVLWAQADQTGVSSLSGLGRNYSTPYGVDSTR